MHALRVCAKHQSAPFIFLQDIIIHALAYAMWCNNYDNSLYIGRIIHMRASFVSIKIKSRDFNFIYYYYYFGPSLSYILASIASFTMWGSASWIRGSDPVIWTFVPGNHDEVPMLRPLWTIDDINPSLHLFRCDPRASPLYLWHPLR